MIQKHFDTIGRADIDVLIANRVNESKTLEYKQTLRSSDKISRTLDGRVFVSSLFEEIRSTLASLKSSRKLPKELGDALDRTFSAIFDHARGLRNQSGHTTGEAVSAENAEAGLLLFPGFYELVDKIDAHFRNPNVTQEGDADV